MASTTSKKRDIAVFIASPGDLGPERQQFRETIETLNTGFGDGADVTFEPLGWDALLSTVGQRSQSVINQEQIDRCDVFILVLNRRWGQEAPDSNYSSYTEEEFHRALVLFESSGTPTIFVFFNRVDPESEGDPGPQLAKVMAFRQSLEDTHKVLYRYFDDINSFADEVDKHLRAFARDELPDAGGGNNRIDVTAAERNGSDTGSKTGCTSCTGGSPGITRASGHRINAGRSVSVATG